MSYPGRIPKLHQETAPVAAVKGRGKGIHDLPGLCAEPKGYNSQGLPFGSGLPSQTKRLSQPRDEGQCDEGSNERSREPADGGPIGKAE